MAHPGKVTGMPDRVGLFRRFISWLGEKCYSVQVMDGLRILHDSGDTGQRVLNKVGRALALIHKYDPARYRQVIRDLRRVWVMPGPAYSACYHPETSTCELNEAFVLDDTTTSERIASCIVHEATHARLHGAGIGYKETDRARIEGICIRREMAFAKKLPDGAENSRQAKAKLDHLPDLSDRAMSERNLAGLRTALLYLDAPKWLADLVVWWHRRRFSRQPTR